MHLFQGSFHVPELLSSSCVSGKDHVLHNVNNFLELFSTRRDTHALPVWQRIPHGICSFQSIFFWLTKVLLIKLVINQATSNFIQKHMPLTCSTDRRKPTIIILPMMHAFFPTFQLLKILCALLTACQ